MDMRRRGSSVCCFAALLCITLASHGAFAGTPGTCSNPSSDCTYQCPTDGSTCRITLMRTSDGNVNMMMGNPATAVTIFCAKLGTPIQWVAGDATSFVDVRFASGSTPFSQSSIMTDSVNQPSGVSTSVINASSPCYSFAIASCPLAPGGSCGYADPRVVMNPPNLLRHHHHHHNATPATTPPKQ